MNTNPSSKPGAIHSQLLITTSLCAVIALPAFAKSLSFSQVDTNGNGELSIDELEKAFGTRGADQIRVRTDLDKNGSVSRAEIQASQDERSDESDDDDDNDESDENDSDESDDDGDNDRGDESDGDSGGDEGDSGGDEGDD